MELGQLGLVNQGGLIKQKRNHGHLGHVIKVGLSEPTPMTTLVPFRMEGNSSIDFGLANHLQHVHFGWVYKKFPFLNFFFKLVLQTYQPHFKACNPSSSLLCIFGGPNILVSSVSKSNIHNSISSAITHFNVSSIVSCHHLF
jgi:hypothetical protein